MGNDTLSISPIFVLIFLVIGMVILLLIYKLRFRRVSDINSKFPHALKRYCSDNKIEYKNFVYDFAIKDAFAIGKISNQTWETIEHEELMSINKEYQVLKEKCPYGLEVAIDKYNNTDAEFLINQKSFIFQQQRLYDDEILFNDWENQQVNFSNGFFKVLSQYHLIKRYIHHAELDKKDRFGIVTKGKFDVPFVCRFQSTSSNEIDASELEFNLEWEIFRDYLLENHHDDNACEDEILDIVHLLNAHYGDSITFVVTDIDKNTLSNIISSDTPNRQVNLINRLKAEGINAVRLKQIYGVDDLKSNKIVIVSNTLVLPYLQPVIKSIQESRKRDKICVCCVASVADHSTGFAKKLITEEKKRQEISHAIQDFHESIRNNSVDGIIKNYQKAVKLIETDNKFEAFFKPALNIIKDKFNEFDQKYSEGIICCEDIISVEYTTPIDYRFQDTTRYWFALFPTPQTKIFPYRRRKVNRRGYSEELFEMMLRKYLTQTSIISDASLFISESSQYEPDIAIIYKNNVQINIDVEIDEPYSGYDRKPIHYIDSAADLYRDQIFVNAGWLVVRFAEEQVVKSPLSCVLAIARILHAIDNQYVINKQLYSEIDKSNETLKLIPKWSKDEALDMAASNYREKYLGISTFGKVENQKDDKSKLQFTEIERILANELPSIEICSQDYTIDTPNKIKQPDNKQPLKQTSTEKELYVDLLKEIAPKEITPKEIKTKRHIVCIDSVIKSQRSSKTVYSINELMRFYFRSINHNYIAELKSRGDENVANSVLKSLAIEEQKNEYIYKQLSNLVNSNQIQKTIEVQYNGRYLADVDVSKEIILIEEFIKSKGVTPDVAGIEVFDSFHNLVAPIGCLYGNNLYDFDIYTEYRGCDRGKSILTHLGDVPNERNDLAASLKAVMLEAHLNLQIEKIYTVTIDVKQNEYRIRRVRRRTSEAQNVLKELRLNPIKQHEKL